MSSSEQRKDTEAVIQVCNVSKDYYFYNNPLLKLWDLAVRAPGRNGISYQALESVDFSVLRGESVALVGHNGSGKSTLLKLLAGVAKVTSGQIVCHGRVAALLELGTGFHGEFSGRENLLMNARMNGLADDEIQCRLKDIIEFSELGEFIDRKVRTYSSGMLLRLGFSLATHVDADVLLVDEALSVGDAYFQSKCIRRIQHLVREEGKTLFYVSHDPSSVKFICERALLLSKGRLIGDGAPDTVLDHYNALSARENKLDEEALVRAYKGEGGIQSGNPLFVVLSVDLLDSEGKNRSSFISGESARLECVFCYNGPEKISGLTMGLMIRDSKGYEVFGTNTYLNGLQLADCHPGRKQVVSFEAPLTLGRGRYSVTLAFHTGRDHTALNYKWLDKILMIDVIDDHRYIFDGVARLDGIFKNQEIGEN